MKHLHDKVNVIPVIGKSDACTQDEIRRFKSAVSYSSYRVTLNKVKEEFSSAHFFRNLFSRKSIKRKANLYVIVIN
jgi:septin family protein